MITTIIRIIGYIATGAGTLLLIDNHRTLSVYIAMGLWLFIIIIRLYLDEFSKIHTDLKIYGWIYYVLFFCYLFLGTIHVSHIDASHVALYSPLWHKIDGGEKVDTLSLRSHVDCQYYSHSEHYEEFYFLTVRDSIHIYNRLGLVMKIHKNRHSIIQRQYYGGVLVDLIKDADGHVYSLDGELIDDDWKPRLHDKTPIDYTNL